MNQVAQESLVIQWSCGLEPHRLFRHLAEGCGVVFFDSAGDDPQLNGLSILAWDPVSTLTVDTHGSASIRRFTGETLSEDSDPFNALRKFLTPDTSVSPETGASFTSGMAAGYLSYDLRTHLETFKHPNVDPMGTNLMVFHLYDTVVVFDHTSRSYRIIAADVDRERPSPFDRAKAFEADLNKAAEFVGAERLENAPLSASSGMPDGFSAEFSRDEYLTAVEAAKEHIRAGDIFQVNLAQPFSRPLRSEPSCLFGTLRRRTHAPFSSYFCSPDLVLVSMSPERYLKLSDGKVETRPIKGTRPRGADAHSDERLAAELLSSKKDAAENVMIVDVLRNDLGKVCKIGSVSVEQLLALETYETVHHLVSVVTGELDEGRDLVDLLKAAFPGGSITGAPKIRAMQIIDELEHSARGPYTGAMGYVDLNGDADFNILIRSLVIQDGDIRFHVGGGIVSDSDAESEYEETIHKARALFDGILEAEEAQCSN